ncbi:MAG: c-type cytochrome [Bacteroidetes bacterium]|nr:c-type cytochrome [Bacteroidota bacterium]
MQSYKKLFVAAGLAAFVIIGTAASKPPEDFKNLKVLPKHISHEELGKVMHGFNDALGVRCDFCHAPSEDGKHMDFASDAKPEKSIARKMISMTNKINKKFFHGSSKVGEENAQLEVLCGTCHHGSPHPEFEAKGEQGKKPMEEKKD